MVDSGNILILENFCKNNHFSHFLLSKYQIAILDIQYVLYKFYLILREISLPTFSAIVA